MMRNPLRLAHSLLLAGAGLLTTGIAPGGAQADPDVEALLQLHHEHCVARVSSQAAQSIYWFGAWRPGDRRSASS